MKVVELIARFNAFSDALDKHGRLWGESLNTHIPDFPVINGEELHQQERELHRMLAVLNPFINRLAYGRRMSGYGQEWDFFASAVRNDVAQRKGKSLRETIQQVDGINALLELKDPESDVRTSSQSPGTAHRIFISHGLVTPALDKVERFVRALGLAPVIVKNEPSLGGAVDDVVERQMDSCTAAIILATADEQVTDRRQPRPNVLHEIGTAQQKLEDRVIYLKEQGYEFPSNVRPKIWESFAQENMQEAFIKIAKELHGFGLI